MADLAGAGTRVLLVATASHEAGSTLPDLPPVLSTLEDLAEALTGRCGVEPSRIGRVTDPENPIALANAIKAAAGRAGDVFVFWYAGHGLLGGGGELHLATRATVDVARGLAAFQALPFSQVHDVLREHCPARTVVLVVDACHAGRAAQGGLGSLSAGLDRGGGRRFLLASAARDEHAIAPPGARHTAFTGALLTLLRDGDPHGGPELTLDRLARVLARTLPERGYPAPQWWAAHDAGDLVVAGNPAYRPPAASRRPVAGGSREHDTGDLDLVCPYPGLASFGPEDARFFHGRSSLVNDLVKLVAIRADDGPLLVVGSSGSGKSSLVRAGLLPALARGDVGDGASAHWPQILLTPGPDPLGTLAQRLAGPVGTDPGDLVEAWRADPVSFAGCLHGVTGTGGRPAERDRVVLVVDQFEELFTHCEHPTDREAFVRALEYASAADASTASAVGDRHTSVAAVVLVLRADFLQGCTAFPPLARALRRGPLVVEPMNRDEVRRAIEVPARTAGLALEPGLVDLLLAHMGAAGGRSHDLGALPMLAHALFETWLRRDHRVLTVAGYRETGGIEAAISQRAESVYGTLDPAGQAAARAMLVRLVHADDKTRRRVGKATLLAGTDDGAVAAGVLGRLADARLLTVGEDSVEIAHEALLRAWPRLLDWLAADRDLQSLSQEVEADAGRWDAARREEGPLRTRVDRRRHRRQRRHRRWPWRRQRGSASRDLLYRPGQLAAVHQGLGGRRLTDPLARDFLRASDALQRRATRFRRSVVATLAALLAVAVTAAGFAWEQRQAAMDSEREAVAQQRQAVTQQRQAVSRDLLGQAELHRDTDPRGALQRAIAAHRITPASEAEAVTSIVNTLAGTSYAGTLTGHQDLVAVVAFAPDGRTLASASNDGTVLVWDVSDREAPRRLGRPLSGHEGSVYGVAFAPDGRTLATAGTDTTVIVWDLSDRDAPRRLGQPLSGHEGPVFRVAFAPDGRALGTTSGDKTVILWDLDRLNDLRATALERACRVVGTGLSREEWTIVVPGIPYLDACPH